MMLRYGVAKLIDEIERMRIDSDNDLSANEGMVTHGMYYSMNTLPNYRAFLERITS